MRANIFMHKIVPSSGKRAATLWQHQQRRAQRRRRSEATRQRHVVIETRRQSAAKASRGSGSTHRLRPTRIRRRKRLSEAAAARSAHVQRSRWPRAARCAGSSSMRTRSACLRSTASSTPIAFNAAIAKPLLLQK